MADGAMNQLRGRRKRGQPAPDRWLRGDAQRFRHSAGVLATWTPPVAGDERPLASRLRLLPDTVQSWRDSGVPAPLYWFSQTPVPGEASGKKPELPVKGHNLKVQPQNTIKVLTPLLRRLAEHIERFQEGSGLGLGFGPNALVPPKQGWLEQPLDPFNTSDQRSFLQCALDPRAALSFFSLHFPCPSGAIFDPLLPVLQIEQQIHQQHLHKPSSHTTKYIRKTHKGKRPQQTGNKEQVRTLNPHLLLHPTSQRYWVNDQHWASRHGPVFLHLGGEGSLRPGSVTRGHPAALAPAWGALVIGLEHRFYGLSIPAGGLDVAQLRFLSSRHALADVASARLALGRLFNVSSSSPWICFGGSYAGSLAAWARLKFPHLIFASVASSAPVRAVLDFSEYNEVVSRSLTSEAVGGSPECRAAAAAAFADVERRLLAGGAARAALRAELGACAPLGRAEDRAELLGALQALVGGAAQYDAQAGAPLSVRRLCGLFLQGGGNRSHSAPYRGLRRAVQVVIHSLGQRCLSFSRAETVAQLKVTESQVSGVGDRQWLYQTCTEFGFYVTCEDPSCPFSRVPALPSQLELCQQVFGLSTSSVAQAVTQTNSYYGGQTPGATQVLFVNGDTDPWHALSVTQASGPSASALLIPGASHCMDMAPERPSDSPSLRRGRQSISQQLQTWFGLAQRSQARGGD
ncbi:thymus-specific serine protease [Panthera onca]